MTKQGVLPLQGGLHGSALGDVHDRALVVPHAAVLVLDHPRVLGNPDDAAVLAPDCRLEVEDLVAFLQDAHELVPAPGLDVEFGADVREVADELPRGVESVDARQGGVGLQVAAPGRGPEYAFHGVLEDAAEIFLGFAQFLFVADVLRHVAERADVETVLDPRGACEHGFEGELPAVGATARDFGAGLGQQDAQFGLGNPAAGPQQFGERHPPQGGVGIAEHPGRPCIGGDDAQRVRGEDQDGVCGAGHDALGPGRVAAWAAALAAAMPGK